jgi:predicted metal-dependent hydrolase
MVCARRRKKDHACAMTRPAPDRDIVPRDLRFGVQDHADRAWFGGSEMLSMVVDAFAVALPEGERFFIRSLKHYAQDIPDEDIQAGIRGYALQEAFHTREHEGYNAALRRLGYDVDRMEERSARLLGNPRFGPVLRLFSTCAIEQATYSLSRFILKRPALMARAAPAYRRLWQWHALEEIEHSSVALAVLRRAPIGMAPWQRYVTRVAVLNFVFAQMTWLALANVMTMLRSSRGRVTAGDLLRLGWVLLGRPGFLYSLVVPYLAFLKPGYAGGGAADAALVEHGRRVVAQDMPAATVPA